MTAPGSPWITMYLVPARCKPVGARCPGSSKSLMISLISWVLNWKYYNRSGLRLNIDNFIANKILYCESKSIRFHRNKYVLVIASQNKATSNEFTIMWLFYPNQQCMKKMTWHCYSDGGSKDAARLRMNWRENQLWTGSQTGMQPHCDYHSVIVIHWKMTRSDQF